MLKLYFSQGTCALASHITLYETGAPFMTEEVDFAAGQQRTPQYLRVNPKGRVPALVDARGALTETPAILLYLAQRFPEAELAPLDDPFALAELQGFTSYLCSTVHVAHAHGRRGARWADDPAAWEAMKAKVPQSMTEVMALIEDGMLKGPWVMGERYSVADPYLYTVSRWLEGDRVDLSKLPRVLEHRARMQERGAVQSALAVERLSPV